MTMGAALLLAAAVGAVGHDVTIVRHGPVLQAAFKAAYGETKRHHVADADGYTLTPFALVHTRTGFFLVAAADNESGCHACAAGIAVTAFADDHGRPGRVTGRLPITSGGDGSDEPAPWHIDYRLTREPALLIGGGWGGGGCRSHGVGVVELLPVPVERLEFLDLARDQEDIGDASGSEHIVSRLVPGRRGERFVMHYRGWTKPGAYHRVPLDITVSYRMTNGRFVADKVVDDLRC